MKITPEQLDKSKKKRIGRYKGAPVWELVTKGGLNMILAEGPNGIKKMLSCGPHRGFARNLARQNHADFILEELSKADEEFNPETSKHLIPFYQDLTDRLDVKMNEGE